MCVRERESDRLFRCSFQDDGDGALPAARCYRDLAEAVPVCVCVCVWTCVLRNSRGAIDPLARPAPCELTRLASHCPQLLLLRPSLSHSLSTSRRAAAPCQSSTHTHTNIHSLRHTALYNITRRNETSILYPFPAGVQDTRRDPH